MHCLLRSHLFRTQSSCEEGKSLSQPGWGIGPAGWLRSQLSEPHRQKRSLRTGGELSAVGHDSGNLPLVRTRDKKLYFRRYYEYEKQELRHLASALLKKIAKGPLKDGIMTFFNHWMSSKCLQR